MMGSEGQEGEVHEEKGTEMSYRKKRRRERYKEERREVAMDKGKRWWMTRERNTKEEGVERG